MPARSVQITFVNQTAHTLRRLSDHLNHGKWTTNSECPAVIGPQATVNWESQSDGVLTGTEGEVTYTISNDQGDFAGIPPPYQIHIHWDNPYVGHNSYSDTVPPVVRLTHTDGSGDNASLTYTLTEVSWFTLRNWAPFGVGMMLLLTDGSVLVFENNGNRMAKLIPDSTGSYVNGTFNTVAPMLTPRQDFASAVLADGRVFVAGGEYAGGANQAETSACEIYDPTTDTWTPLPSPPWKQVGDAPSCVLADGRVIIGGISSATTAIFDPSTNSFEAADSKNNYASKEETWTLLPDGSVLTVDCSPTPTQKAQRYLPSDNVWFPAANTPVQLEQTAANEIGPAILLPSGNVFAVGATGYTAIYQPPPVLIRSGTWTNGPAFPNDSTGRLMEAKDAPACLLPNGTVVCAAGPHDESSRGFTGPVAFFIYDPVANTLEPLATTGLESTRFDTSLATENYTFLLLPTGDMLVCEGDQIIAVYRPGGPPPLDAWRPVVISIFDATGVPTTGLREGLTYVLNGTLINGLSQACSYGDDAQMATNYPIVRIGTSDGLMHYCRTHGHSTMGVADRTPQSTNFDVPNGIAVGWAELVVIANGIVSLPLTVLVSIR